MTFPKGDSEAINYFFNGNFQKCTEKFLRIGSPVYVRVTTKDHFFRMMSQDMRIEKFICKFFMSCRF